MKYNWDGAISTVGPYVSDDAVFGSRQKKRYFSVFQNVRTFSGAHTAPQIIDAEVLPKTVNRSI
jgi:hypothetical protein